MLCEAAVLMAVAQCTKEWGQNIWLELVCVLVISQQRASEYIRRGVSIQGAKCKDKCK